MKKRRLKKYVLPTLYSLTIGIIVVCLTLISGNVSGDPNNSYDYVRSGLINTILPVFSEDNTEIIRPYDNESVNLKNSFYNKDADDKSQQQSIIYYENTYMPNTGVVYSSKEKFDVAAVLAGTVTNIKKDDTLGTIVIINHGHNIITTYYGLDEIMVKENQEVSQGCLLGKSSTSKIFKEPSILFEVSINGSIVDPETFYTMNIQELFK